LIYQLLDILRFTAIAILVLMIFILTPISRKEKNLISGVLLSIAIICYLLVDWPETSNWTIFYFLLPGAFCLPYLFWLFSKSLFDDEFVFKEKHFLFLLGVVLVYYIIFIQGRFQYFGESDILSIITGFLSQLISLVFVILAILEASKGKGSDLIENRLKFRNLFILLSSSLIIITLLTEISLKDVRPPPLLELLQKFVIAFLVFFFSIKTLRLESGFLLRDRKKINQVSNQAEDPSIQRIMEKLNRAMEEENQYQKEGLTIREFSERLDEQEYKVRRAINKQMGFRNFNEYLNSFRIAEACQILSDPEKSDFTILEIAFNLGFQSLAPFNKAFKRQTELTPTEYRKRHMA